MRFNESDSKTTQQLDFAPRHRQQEVWRTIAYFALAIVVVALVVLAPGAVEHKNIGGIIAIIVVATLGFFVVSDKQRTLDSFMTTEFQNLLFSQAATLGTAFCLFVRRDGTIVYADDGLRKTFKHFTYAESMALEGLFAESGVTKNDRDRLMNALYSDSTDRLVFPIKQGNGEVKEYILTVEPIPRPNGFAVVRGREYRAARAGTQLMPETLRAISGDKIDHLLTTTAVPQFIVDPYGRIEFVTPALEMLLGYQHGEMTESRLSIQRLFYQLNGRTIPDDYTLVDFHGEALLKKKSTALVQTILELSLMRDAEGKVTGATGSMLPYMKQQ